MKNYGKKSTKPKDYDLNGLVDSMVDGFRKNLGNVKSSAPQMSFETGNKDGRFYEDAQRRANEQRAELYKYFPHIPTPVLKTTSEGLSYYDLTSDKKGLDEKFDPTPLEVAKLAEYSYSVFPPGEKITVDEEYTGIENWVLTDESYQNDQGLDIAVFRKYVNGKECYIVVNVGSETKLKTDEDRKEFKDDWSNNIKQPFGYSQDMNDSIEFANNFVKEHPDANIIFAGHSKGGAEAAANAVATNRRAILFNPASVNLNAYGLNQDNYDSDMVAYVVDGEILNNIFGSISKPIDKIEVISEESVWEKLFKRITIFGKIYELFDGLDNHSIDSVINGLEKEEK